MSDNKLNKIMADLIYEANTVLAARVVFRTLNGNVNLINWHVEYAPFFDVVRDTCRQRLFLSTVKIFDQYQHKEKSSLKSLKKALEQGEGVEIDKDKADEIIKTIDDFLRDNDIAGILKRVEEIRHQFIAHKQTEPEQNARDITMDEFDRLIDKTIGLLSQVADRTGFHEEGIITGSAVKSSTQNVLDTLFPEQQER